MEEAKEMIKAMSIASFLSERGYVGKKMGKRWFFLSPISGESNPSLLVNADNTFYDFSSGKGGDIISLVQNMWGVGFLDALSILKQDLPYIPQAPKKREGEVEVVKRFNFERYLTDSRRDSMLIKHVMNARGIRNFYLDGKFWAGHHVAGALFPHYDPSGELKGCKIRNVEGMGRKWHFDGDPKSAYVVDCTRPYSYLTTLYISESETSSNSLAEVLLEYGKSGVVVSFGGWNGIVEAIDDWSSYFSNFRRKKIIIDYDGSEDTFQERMRVYEGIEGEFVKMILPKGEDINSLYATKKHHIIKTFI